MLRTTIVAEKETSIVSSIPLPADSFPSPLLLMPAAEWLPLVTVNLANQSMTLTRLIEMKMISKAS